MKTRIALLAAIAALAGCTAQEEQSVANRFEATENAIENAAATIESATENNIRAAENALDADAIENRIDAIDIVPSENKAGNSQ